MEAPLFSRMCKEVRREKKPPNAQACIAHRFDNIQIECVELKKKGHTSAQKKNTSKLIDGLNYVSILQQMAR